VPVVLDLAQQSQLAVGREEAGFDAVGSEFAELVEGELELAVGEQVLVEQVGGGSSELRVTMRPSSK